MSVEIQKLEHLHQKCNESNDNFFHNCVQEKFEKRRSFLTNEIMLLGTQVFAIY